MKGINMGNTLLPMSLYYMCVFFSSLSCSRVGVLSAGYGGFVWRLYGGSSLSQDLVRLYP